MTRDDIIRMAKEAGLAPASFCRWSAYSDDLERFATLVAAEKEQQMIRDGWRQCAEGQRTTQHCKLLDAAVKAEQEKVARWMIRKGYATGHGDTTEDLLAELEWQIEEEKGKG